MESKVQGANTDFKPPRFKIEFREKKESDENFKSTRILSGEIVLASTAKILST